MKTHRLGSILLCLAWTVTIVLTASPARAQITPLGASPLAPSAVLGTFEYDDKHDVYLHVWEFQRRVWGRFIAANGTVLGQSFVVSTHLQSFAGRPKVAYTRGSVADQFLVIYASDFNLFDKSSNIFGQFVRYTAQGPTGGTLLGDFITVPTVFPNSALLQYPSTVLFNPTTSRFFIVWEEIPGGYEVVGRHIDLNGLPVGDAVNISTASGSQGQGQAAYDSEANRYLVAYVGDLAAGSPLLGTFARVLDGNTGQPTSGILQLTLGTALVLEAATAYLPERDGFIVTWTAFKPDRTVAARFVPSNGSGLPDAAYLALDTPGQDGAASVTYDPVSRWTVVAAMSDPQFIRGALLNGNGAPQTAPFVLGTVPSSPGLGSFYPVVKPAEGGVVGLTYVNDYSFAVFERFQLEQAQPPPPETRPLTWVDTPGNGAVVSLPFYFGGWAVDLASTSGPGVDAVHVYAYPTSGGPIFLGAATFGARPDLGAYFGPQFTNSGWGLIVRGLRSGNYLLVAFAHSTVTGAFNAKYIGVTVGPTAAMNVDVPLNPGPHTLPNLPFTIAGWAIDQGATSGTGVNFVHVWALRAEPGSKSVFLGEATLGLERLDVGEFFGPQFTNGGFALNTYLAPGTYYLSVSAGSAVTGNLDVRTVVIIISPS